MMEALFQLDRFGWLLIDVAWKSTVLLLVAYTADRLFLRRRLIAADDLWSSTLLMLVLMPLCCLLLPKYTIEVPSPYMQQADSQATRSSYIHTNNAIAQPLQLHELLEVGPVAVVTEKPVVEKADVTLSSKLLANGMPIVSLMYCLGTLVLSVRLASGLFLIRRLTRTANPISSDAWMKLFHHHKQQLGIRRAISLNHSPKVSVPLTIGWIRPVVILPTSTYNEYTRRTIEVVILHELTHIARGDYFVHIITKFAQCLYWYNPLMWIASWRHCHVRETVCDGYCISSLKDGSSPKSVGGKW